MTDSVAFDLSKAVLRIKDEARNFRYDGSPRDFVIEGNPHTFPGRFSVIDVITGRYELVSPYDVEWASPLAAAWIAGFICGQEPSLMDFFGEREVSLEQAEWWQRYLVRFRASGGRFAGGVFPYEPLPPEVDAVRDLAWTLVGDTIVRWCHGQARWVFTQDDYDTVMAGTICAEQGHQGEQPASETVSFFCPICKMFGAA